MSQSFHVRGVHLEVECRVFGSDRGPDLKSLGRSRGKEFNSLDSTASRKIRTITLTPSEKTIRGIWIRGKSPTLLRGLWSS